VLGKWVEFTDLLPEEGDALVPIGVEPSDGLVPIGPIESDVREKELMMETDHGY